MFASVTCLSCILFAIFYRDAWLLVVHAPCLLRVPNLGIRLHHMLHLLYPDENLKIRKYFLRIARQLFLSYMKDIAFPLVRAPQGLDLGEALWLSTKSINAQC